VELYTCVIVLSLMGQKLYNLVRKTQHIKHFMVFSILMLLTSQNCLHRVRHLKVFQTVLVSHLSISIKSALKKFSSLGLVLF
jgi:HJR/Mrr/RecB family endonuclease